MYLPGGMTSMRSASSRDYSIQFLCGPCGPEAGPSLEIQRMQLHEACSRPYRLKVVGTWGAEYEPLQPDQLRGLEATLVVSFRGTDTVLRYVHGIVHGVQESYNAAAGADQVLSFDVVPKLSLLKMRRNSRIFRGPTDTSGITTKEIVETLLKENGLVADDFSFQNVNTLKRLVCTQYEETDFDFVSRLLEEEGVGYCFDHTKDGARLLFFDSQGGFVDSEASYPLVAGTGATQESVQAVTAFKALRPSKVVLRDHNFTLSGQQTIEVSASDSSGSGLEYYEYPGRFSDEATGKQFAQFRLEELTALAEGLSGTGQVLSLTPGHIFTFEQPSGDGRKRFPASADFDADGHSPWVPVSAYHQWFVNEQGHASVKTQFRARPGNVAYRPERRTPRARVKGPMQAIVTTTPGEEIDCDAFGCVKVQFFWDRFGKQDDKSSGWVRVLQMQSSGSVAIPRKGWEVLVECEDGDPDKPVIVGRLYNSGNAPPASLPTEKTVTAFQSFSTPAGGGHNEIRINDGTGGELISVHAQKEMNVVVANDRKIHVTNNSTVGVGANQELSVGVARLEDVGANDELVVGASQKWSVGAVRTETVTSDSRVDIKGKRDTSIGVSHMTMTPQAVTINTSGNCSETVGGLCLEAAGMESSMTIGGKYSATVGGAMIQAVAAGMTQTTVGSRSMTVGGAFINAAGKDVTYASKGSKKTTVGGVMMLAGGENAELSAKTDLKIKIGAALAVAGTTVILKVGGSTITLGNGSAAVASKQIILEATGPNAELAPMVGSK